MSVFKKANDKLSRKASEVYRLFQDTSECHADVDAWYAPSECHDLVNQSYRKEMKELFPTVEDAVDFIMRLERATSSKFVYFSGFYDVLDVFPYENVDRAMHEWREKHPVESGAVTVMNLATTDKFIYTCSPEEAVIAAYAQNEKNDWNTWDYAERYGHMLERGAHTVNCGDYSAFYCDCHRWRVV